MAAHTVFVSTDELDYVHVHAHAMAAPMPGQAAHGAHGDPGAVPALMPHAKPEHAEPYVLWIQFKVGDKIRTVPFLVTVPAAS